MRVYTSSGVVHMGQSWLRADLGPQRLLAEDGDCSGAGIPRFWRGSISAALGALSAAARPGQPGSGSSSGTPGSEKGSGAPAWVAPPSASPKPCSTPWERRHRPLSFCRMKTMGDLRSKRKRRFPTFLLGDLALEMSPDSFMGTRGQGVLSSLRGRAGGP